MNTRILTVVGAVTLLCTMSGCSGMRNFLFGRGARCGLCSGLKSPATSALTGQIPITKPFGATAGLSNQLGCGLEAGCGREVGCGHEAGCGFEAGCGREAIGNTCSCGNSYAPAISSYGPQVSSPVVSDPYLAGSIPTGEIVGGSYPIEGQVIGGEIVGSSYPVDGQIIGGQVIGGEVIGGGYPIGGQVISDGSWYQRGSGYTSNRVDMDGHRIISEDPLPPGAIPTN